MTSAAAIHAVSEGLHKLHVLPKVSTDAEDHGEAIGHSSVGGGGQSGLRSVNAKGVLRVSRALTAMLATEGVISDQDAEGDLAHPSAAVKALLEKPHIKVPPELLDKSHPLSEYFISSSHNTYLMGEQLYGTSGSEGYEVALQTGARCVEIDAWDNEENKEEPKVTHGYTLASHIPFRLVCETIRNVMDHEAKASARSGSRPGPILISLENHCHAQGQQRIVSIFKEVLGDRLISKAVRDEGHEEQKETGTQVRLEELEAKVALIVEFYFPDGKEIAAEEAMKEEEEVEVHDPNEDEAAKQARLKFEETKKNAPKPKIIPELAELGVYAQSVKPRDRSWLEGQLKGGPHDHLINVSETQVTDLMGSSKAQLAQHNSKHLMRVFPKGTRITSSNMNQVPYWGVGAQICALNWQTFGCALQLNEAMFAGSDGYVLKPAALRAGGSGQVSSGKKKKLQMLVEGATDLHIPPEYQIVVEPYVTCTLHHPDDLKNVRPKQKTEPYRSHKLTSRYKHFAPPASNPIWGKTLEWEYEENELAFLRILIKSEETFHKNPAWAVAAVRLSYVQQGWSFIRMLDLSGGETNCTLLVRFTITDA
ncbi:phosphatidylinositol-specific phospholipase C [Neohortaea acidophila]|uniref:Phosphoinositide phospholipase C n=1 Tax=Neohortaea acidophila TaxID=245834 RepID=A0A6A6PZN2_9PEZI|nr:phosphatidylinositol-specific phospholipase C [Neohortaea acidophila]KAF2485668.1 phosphatidylinositol-specific phospholipase C [Neohortaea acidophila]